jgi:hypothetical protein
MICCGVCKNYIDSFDTDRHRKCRVTGKRHWPGDSAYECPSLVIAMAAWERRKEEVQYG